jgi:cell shape-determining protein MreC
VFPVGLPVGVVTAVTEEGVRVAPFADAINIEYVRLMDFGLDGILHDTMKTGLSDRIADRSGDGLR